MADSPKPRPWPISPSTAIALIALFVALGGGAIAATRHADRDKDAALIRSLAPSHSYESFKNTPVEVKSTTSSAATGIGALRLPRGRYAVTAKLHVYATGAGTVYMASTYTPVNCVLGGGQTDTARATLSFTAGDTDQTLTLLGRAIVTAPSKNVFVACWRDEDGNTIFANMLKIVAIRVHRADAVPSG